MTWPDGIFSGLKLVGRARDMRTGPDGGTTVVDQVDLTVRTALDRTVQALSSTPARPGLDRLVGARAGSNLRGALAEVVPDLRDRGAPLYLLLDDLAGASLIAGFVWSRWPEALPDLSELRGRIPMRSMRGICSGFRPGASSLNPDGTQSGIAHDVKVVPPLCDPADPVGWHELDASPGMAMRRARRIDVWEADGELRIDAMFRDSCWRPDSVEVAVHEYQLFASALVDGGRLTSVEALPRVLPYDECPLAASNVGVLTDVPMAGLRDEVLRRLRGTVGCTHLNDALRALAEVPVLAAAIAAGPSAPEQFRPSAPSEPFV